MWAEKLSQSDCNIFKIALYFLQFETPISIFLASFNERKLLKCSFLSLKCFGGLFKPPLGSAMDLTP